jgi:trans-2,3-dihydro-3-hydroxyanthranilate isomerase
MFGPHVIDIPEDPATGIAAGPMGAYAAQYNVLPRQPVLRFIIEQGIEMGRPSQIHVEVKSEDDYIRKIRIGGQAVIVGEGHIFW